MNRPEDSKERAALEALSKLPSQKAPEDLREQVRGSFLAAADEPLARGFRARRLALPAAAIAALLAVMAYGSMPRADWVITAVHEPDGIVVDGETPEIGAALRRAEIRTSQTGELEVGFEDRLRLRFVGGAQARLPKGPGRWFLTGRTIVLQQGEVFGSTGGEPLDFTLRFQTEIAMAALSGTTFAAIRLEDATCFCLYTGALEIIQSIDGERVELPAGQRVFLYDDGRPPEFAPLDQREQMKLQMMHQQGQEL